VNVTLFKLMTATCVGALTLTSCPAIDPGKIDSDKPKIISGSVVDNRARRISIARPGTVRVQDAPPVFAPTPLDFELSLEGVNVLAVTASGEVLTSSAIDPLTGAFNLNLDKDRTVALVLATKGSSGKWLCQQALEFFGAGALKTAALQVSADANLGAFAFNDVSGRAAAETPTTVTTSNDAAFSDDSLNGYQRCGNENAVDSTISLDYNFLEVPVAGFVADDPRYFENTVVFALDGAGRWVGSAPASSGTGIAETSGSSQIRVRLEPSMTRNVTPVLFDTRAASADVLRTPTWNLDQAPRTLLAEKGVDFGALRGDLILIGGETTNDQGKSVANVNVSVELSGDLSPNRESSNLTRSRPDGKYKLLVPKPGDTGTWLLRAQSDDGNINGKLVLDLATIPGSSNNAEVPIGTIVVSGNGTITNP
jgi:hypothetical protein